MKEKKGYNIKYFNITEQDEAWGLVVTTAGCQRILPQSVYPCSNHPDSYVFAPRNGRVLKEFQLIYISEGRGYFESESVKRKKIEAGTMIMLFPNEWHTYEPDVELGWFEHWVGFEGFHINDRVDKGFFSHEKPLYNLGFNSSVIGLYEEIIAYSIEEKTGYQQLVSSLIEHLLGLLYYKNINLALTDSFSINKINEARAIMRQSIVSNISPTTIAERLGVSYSWFRKMFKKYVGVSPAQYQANLKFLISKELLDTTNLTITEIAYQLNFETAGQFSTFFHKRASITPSGYRNEGRSIKDF